MSIQGTYIEVMAQQLRQAIEEQAVLETRSQIVSAIASVVQISDKVAALDKEIPEEPPSQDDPDAFLSALGSLQAVIALSALVDDLLEMQVWHNDGLIPLRDVIAHHEYDITSVMELVKMGMAINDAFNEGDFEKADELSKQSFEFILHLDDET